MATPWIIISIGILLILLAVLFFWARNIKKRPTDYYTLFIFGLVWVPLGIATGNSGFWIAGLVFLVAGLLNRDKWEKNRVRWSDLTDEEKKFKKIVIAALALTFLLGLAAFWIFG